MEKSNIYGSGEKRSVNPNWFTGRTWMKVLSKKIQSKEQDIYHVHFEKGSRTKLHSHNGSQILITTQGTGSLELFRKYGNKQENFKIKKTKTINLKKGDIVYIPAKNLHTHGSTNKKNTFSHIAINIIPSKKSKYITDWYESDFKSEVTEKI